MIRMLGLATEGAGLPTAWAAAEIHLAAGGNHRLVLNAGKAGDARPSQR